MTSFHQVFAQDKQTSWLHRFLYKDNMPDSILQAFTTSVIYANRTKANKAWVYVTPEIAGQPDRPMNRLDRYFP